MSGRKLCLTVELVGEPASGKTHFALLFPEPYLINTSPVSEGVPVAMKVLGGDWEKRFVSAGSLKDVRTEVGRVRDGLAGSVRTIIIDTSSDLQKLAAREYLQEKIGEGKKREKVTPIEYGFVRDKVDGIIYDALRAGKHLVVTSLLKDEYAEIRVGESVKSYRTGSRIRDGYARLPQLEDMRLYLRIVTEKQKSKDNVEISVKRRECIVVKNRYRDETKSEWIGSLSENEMNWQGILKLTGMREEVFA